MSAAKFRAPVVYEPDYVRQSGEFAQLDLVIASNAVGFADGGKHLGLLHRVHAQVGFKVEIQIEHIHGIACLFGDQCEYAFFHRIIFGSSLDCDGFRNKWFGCRLLLDPIFHSRTGCNSGRRSKRSSRRMLPYGRRFQEFLLPNIGETRRAVVIGNPQGAANYFETRGGMAGDLA